MNEVVTMPELTAKNLSRFGFSFDKGAIHTKRTMMLKELTDVLGFVHNSSADVTSYYKAIYAENCTAKKSGISRQYTAKYLKKLYLLDPSYCVFRALRFFWERDVEGRNLIAFLCAYARDSILRDTTNYVLGLTQGSQANKDDLHGYLDRIYPGRFSPVMTASLGRNLLSSWTQAGYLKGRIKKIRQRPEVTPGSVAFALLLSYLAGERGEMLFTSKYAILLDCPVDQAFNMIENAAKRGWLIFKRVGNVVEVDFPNLLSTEEMRWIRE